MIFTHSEQRQMLADAIDRFFREQYPIEVRHAAASSDFGFDKQIWRQAADLGLVAALVDEKFGGIGGHAFDIMSVFESLGRYLVVEPFLASAVLGAGLLTEAGTPQHQEWIGAVIDGKQTLAFAHSEPDSRYELAHVSTSAQPHGDGWRLNGHKSVVINGDSADALIVSARTANSDTPWTESGLSLFVTPAQTPGLAIQGYPTIDGLHAAEIRLENVELPKNALLGVQDQSYALIESTIAKALIALSAEALGLMEVCRDTTLAYLATRQQFGAPIGSFQALQHRMATVAMEIEQARSSVINAAGRFGNSRVERERSVSAAKTMIGRIGRLVAEEAIQLHGGIAMTWEYAIGHYAKRLVMIDHQFGDVDFHTNRYVELGAR